MTTATETMNDTKANEDHSDDHSHAECPRYDDINTPVVLLVGVISSIATFLTIAFVQGMYYQWHNAQVFKTQVENVPVIEIVDEQKRNLTGETADTISIDEAMKQVIAKHGKTH